MAMFSRRRRITDVALALTFATVATTACAGKAASTADGNSAALASALAPSVTAHTFYRPYEQLRDFLPNVRYTESGRASNEAFVPTDSVVLGRVAGVAEGAGFVESGTPPRAGRPGATETAYSDPRADWRTLIVTIAVDEVLGGIPVRDEMQLDLALMGNVASGVDGSAVRRDLEDLGAVVLFSKALPKGPEYLGLQRVLPDASFGLATVADDGKLFFPFAVDDEGPTSSQFLGDITTVAALREEARSPDRYTTARSD